MTLTFGQTIAQRRQWIGWSMAETAFNLGVQVDTYRAWENERHRPHPLMQAGIIEALNGHAIDHAVAILTELSPDIFQGCRSIDPQGTSGRIDANTRSSTGVN